MEDALAASSALVIDCSEGVSLLENADHVHTEGDDGHDHGHYDPHYWMDPDNMAQVVENLYAGLNQADPDHQEQYQNNAQAAAAQLQDFAGSAQTALTAALERNGVRLSGLGGRFCPRPWRRTGWSSPAWSPSTTASATSPSSWMCPCWPPLRRRKAARPAPRRSMRSQPLSLVKEHDLPVIFTEVNGSDATAQAISRETGCAVVQLTMLMDGPDGGTLSDDYCGGLMENIRTIVNGFAGEEVLA